MISVPPPPHSIPTTLGTPYAIDYSQPPTAMDNIMLTTSIALNKKDTKHVIVGLVNGGKTPIAAFKCRGLSDPLIAVMADWNLLVQRADEIGRYFQRSTKNQPADFSINCTYITIKMVQTPRQREMRLLYRPIWLDNLLQRESGLVITLSPMEALNFLRVLPKLQILLDHLFEISSSLSDSTHQTLSPPSQPPLDFEENSQMI